MKVIANKLEEMDKYFSTKGDNEKWGMIAITAGSITFVAYTYFLPYSYLNSYFSRLKLDICTIQKK